METPSEDSGSRASKYSNEDLQSIDQESMDLASSHSSDKETMTYMEEGDEEVNSDTFSDSEREKGRTFSHFHSLEELVLQTTVRLHNAKF